jgi:hypothetical protein
LTGQWVISGHLNEHGGRYVWVTDILNIKKKERCNLKLDNPNSGYCIEDLRGNILVF